MDEQTPSIDVALVPPDDTERESVEKDGANATDEAGEATETGSGRRAQGWGPWRRLKWYWKTRAEYKRAAPLDPEGDSRRSKKTMLPPDDGLAIPSIWVLEFYTPSTLSGLLSGIKKLDWTESRAGSRDLREWMDNVRRGRMAGSINIGQVRPPGKSGVMVEHTAELPKGVEAAFPMLFSLTPGLTGFICRFVLDDRTASAPEEVLRREYSSRYDAARAPGLRELLGFIFMGGPIRMRRNFFFPDMARREEVRATIAAIEGDCVSWVANRLPGAFASLGSRHMPTAILLLTERTEPLSKAAWESRTFDGTGIERVHDSWRSKELPGWALAPPRKIDEDPNRLTFASRRATAFPKEVGYDEPDSNWTIGYRAHDFVHGFLSRWAISCLLEAYEQQLSMIRDTAAVRRAHRPVRDLKKLRTLLRTSLFDLQVFVRETERFTENVRRYGRDVLKPVWAWPPDSEETPIVDSMREYQSRRAQQLGDDARMIETSLSVSSGLTVAIASTRSQRIVVLVSLVSVVVAGIATWVAAGTPGVGP